MQISITISVPDGCEVHVSADQAGASKPAGLPILTRPDAAPCACRRPAGEWFEEQERRERLARRRGTSMEGWPDA